jgi:hypothetical protein
MGEVIEDHIRMHLIDPALQTRYRSGPRRRGADRRGAILPQIDLALNSSGYLIRPPHQLAGLGLSTAWINCPPCVPSFIG